MKTIKKLLLALSLPKMNRLILSLLFACLLVTPAAQSLAGSQPSIEVFFSPQGGCTEAVVNALTHATNTVMVQAYSFTSAPIAKALVDAHRRGVRIQVILDKSQRTEKYSEADFTAHAGIPTFIDARHAIAHNKIIIIDGYEVITGSFNFTRAAEENNAENLLVIQDAALALKYMENWRKHLEHSERYLGERGSITDLPGTRKR